MSDIELDIDLNNIQGAVETFMSTVNTVVKNDDHCVIRQPHIHALEKNLYRLGGSHLSDTGYDIDLNNIQGAVETFMSKTRSFLLM